MNRWCHAVANRHKIWILRDSNIDFSFAMTAYGLREWSLLQLG
jgi:hypothetical protein